MKQRRTGMARNGPAWSLAVAIALALLVLLLWTGNPSVAYAGSVEELEEVEQVDTHCAGDCDYSGDVTVDELLKTLNIALGVAPVDDCPGGDTSGDSQITVDEMIQCLMNILRGCERGV